MRRLEPKKKERRKVLIPVELRDSMREIHKLIQEAKRDRDVVLDYDDAIQVGAVCGGKCGEKPRPFELTYFPTGDADRGRWYLAFHRLEIEDIADGVMTEIVMHCCTAPDCRSKFRNADDHCFYCDYTDDPNYGTFDFPEAGQRLIDRGIVGISDSSSRDDIVATLGPPDSVGGGIKHPPLGYIWPWVLYRRADCQVRFEFNKTMNRVRNVTVLEHDWEPGK